METTNVRVWVLAAFLAIVASCSGSNPPGGPTSPPPTTPPAATVPSPSTPPTPPPTTASCRFGTGTLDTTCARGAEVYEASVGAAIDRVAEQHPDYVDTSINVATGEWLVLRPREYLAGVVSELERRRFCAETDTVATVSLKAGSSFSETWDILQPSGHVRRGRRSYLHTCSPPSFPIDPREAIAYVRVAFYSITCEAGITPPRNGENVLPIGCRGFITATPKQRNNEDVPHHIIGTNVSWRLEQAGEVVRIHDDPNNAFNKTAVPLNPGRYSLCATSHGVEGCQHAEVLRDPR